MKNTSGGMPTWLSLLLFCTYLASIVTAFPTRYPGRTPACLEEESSCDVPSSTVYATIISATASPTQTIATTSSDLSATFSTKPSPSSTPAPSSISAATPVIGKAAEAIRIRSGNRLPQTYNDDQPQHNEIHHQHREGSTKNPPADAFAGLEDDDNDNFFGQNETQSRFVRGDPFVGSFEEQTFSARGGARGHRSQYRASLVTSPKVRRIKEYVFRPHNRYTVDFGLSEVPVGWTPADDMIEEDRRAEREAEKLAAMSAAEADFKAKAATSKASSEAKDAETLLLQQRRIEEEENERKRQSDFALLTERLQAEHNENENRRQEGLNVALAMTADSSTKSNLAKNAADEEREKYEHLVFLQQSLLEQARREYRRAAIMVKPLSRPDEKPSKGPAPPPDDPPPPPEGPSPPQQSQRPPADDVKPPSDDQKPLDNEHTPEAGGAPETVVTVRTVRHDVVRYTSEVTTITNNVIFDWSAVAHTFSRSPLQAPPRAALGEPESVLMSVELITATPAVVEEQSEQPAASTDSSTILSAAAEPEATMSGGVGAKKIDVNMFDILELVKKRRQAESSKRAIALADAQTTSPVTIADSVASTGDCVDLSSLVKHDENAQKPLECKVEPCDTVVNESAGTDDPTAPLPGLPAPMATAEVSLETDDANKTEKMADTDETKSQQSDFAEAVTWPAPLALNVSAVPVDVQPSWIDLSEFRDTLRGIRRFDPCSNQEDVVQTDSVSDSLTKTFNDDGQSDASESAIEPVAPVSVSGSIEVQADAHVAAESLIAETPSMRDALAPQASVELVVNLVSMCPVDVHTDEIPSIVTIAGQTQEAPSLCSDAVETDEAPSARTIAVQTEEAPSMCSVTAQSDDMEAAVSNEKPVLNDETTTFVEIAPAPQSSAASVSVSESSACSLDVQSDGKDAAVASSNEHPCTFEEETTMTEVPALESAIQSVSISSTAICLVAVQEDKVEVSESRKKEQTSNLGILVDDPTSTHDFQSANAQIEDRKDETTPKTHSHFDQHGIPQSTVEGLTVIASTTADRDCDGSTADPKAHPVKLGIETAPKIQKSSVSANNVSRSAAQASPRVPAVTAEQSLVGAFEKIAFDSTTSETRPPSPSIAKTPASKGGKAFKALAWYPPSASSGSGGTASTAVPFSATAFGRIAFGYTAYAESGRLFPNDFAYSASSFGLPPPPSKTTGFAFDCNLKFNSSSRSPVSQSSSHPPVAKACSQPPLSRSDSQPPLPTAILDRVTPPPSGTATLPRAAPSPTALHPSVVEPLQNLDSSKPSLNTKAKKSAETARPSTTVAQEKKELVATAAVKIDATSVQLPSTLFVTQIAATPALLPATMVVTQSAQLPARLTAPSVTPVAVVVESSRSLGTSRWSNPAPKTRSEKGTDNTARAPPATKERTVNEPASMIQISSPSVPLTSSPVVPSSPPALVVANPQRGLASSRWSDPVSKTKNKNDGNNAPQTARVSQERTVNVPTLLTRTLQTSAHSPSTSAVSPGPSTAISTDPTRSLGNSRWATPQSNARRGTDSARSAPVPQERRVNVPMASNRTTPTPARSSESRRGGRG
ncbi:hypothetical protein QFC22_004560 [Naganishia vaughanmartiniae]|uniref:Uncharacterized protein n=1 Tax=Naganishia vaughanmartiniae TaxID=1424756 RepID=A0ACC2WYQ9_9TREE|nr:hypothetical protein QFC22_004560 [Naganishia vaughanmartiniae]